MRQFHQYGQHQIEIRTSSQVFQEEGKAMRPIILVLEDEPLVMTLLRHILKDFALLESSTADEAIRCFKDNISSVRLLLADVTLPVSSGIQLALHLRSKKFDLPIIFTSGYPLVAWNERASADLEKLGRKSVMILQKPFRAELLLDAIRDLIGMPQVHRSAGGS